MIELHDVWRKQNKASQKDKWTLEGVDVSIPSGRRIALIGPDAEANSALLRILSGVDAPDRGAIRRVGSICWPLDYMAFIDTRATFVQNVNFVAQVYGVDASAVADIATRLSGVRVVRGRPMGQYEPVDRRALTLGLTLSMQFDWYFIDERLPKAAMTVAEIEAVIADRFSRASVVWATTKPETVEGYCDAALLLDQGRLIFYNEFCEAVSALQQNNEAKTANAGKPRKPGRRGRAARRESEVDPQNAG